MSTIQDRPEVCFNEDTARLVLERIRWPRGPQCPHNKCGASPESVTAIQGKSRHGLYQCRACRQQFTVTVGTVLQGSRVPLAGWWRAAHLLSDNRYYAPHVSAADIQRALGVTYKTAHAVLWTILDAAAAFRGHVDGFGRAIRAHVRERTKVVNGKQGLAWQRAKQSRSEADAAVDFTALPKAKGFGRTERLMRLLVQTDPRSKTLKREAEKSAARRKRGLRRTKYSDRPLTDA